MAIFQLHETLSTSHCSPLIRDFLDETFRYRWTELDGLWPPRSPDTTPLDFCFWGFIEQNLCTLTSDVEELKVSIKAAVCCATEDITGTGILPDFQGGTH